MNADAYRIMWTVVLFDLPTETKRQRRNYALFRKGLLKAGFTRFQFSVYIRHALSREHMLAHHRRIEHLLPPEGKVSVMQLTDKQFGLTQVFDCPGHSRAPDPTTQLLMFGETRTYEDIKPHVEPILQEETVSYRVPAAEIDTEQDPLGSLWAAGQDERRQSKPEKEKRRRKPPESPEDGQLLLF